MFLSKKIGANALNKNKKIEDKPKRVLGGWDDDQQQSPKPTSNNMPTKNPQKYKSFSQQPILSFEQMPKNIPQQPLSKPSTHKYYNWDELNQMQNMYQSHNISSIEQRLIQQLIQPGGIRIKPADNTLSQFLKQINGLDISIISSLLLSKIEVNYPFQIKAKALYTIEFISKKNKEYFQYFQVQVEKLKQFPEPEDNVENYRKILKNVLNFIGVGVVKNHQHNSQEQIKINFIDPGYNQPQKITQKSQLSTFIKDNSLIIKQKKTQSTKKPIIGPNQLKSKLSQQKNQNKKLNTNNSNLLEQDLLSIEKQPNDNLIQIIPTDQPKQNVKTDLNFQEMISSLPKQTTKEASLGTLNIF